MAADRVNSMREGLWEGRAGTMDQNGDGRTLATSNSILSASTSNVINASGTIISATGGGVGGGGGVTSSSMEHPQSLRIRKKNTETLPPLVSTIYIYGIILWIQI